MWFHLSQWRALVCKPFESRGFKIQFLPRSLSCKPDTISKASATDSESLSALKIPFMFEWEKATKNAICKNNENLTDENLPSFLIFAEAGGNREEICKKSLEKRKTKMCYDKSCRQTSQEGVESCQGFITFWNSSFKLPIVLISIRVSREKVPFRFVTYKTAKYLC